jgi:hypothetical protein
MTRHIRPTFAAAAVMTVGLATAALTPAPAGAQQTPADATVIASGLLGPRGLRFGPDNALYVAEAGSGGTTSTAGQCTQVPVPIGPYTGGPTARISKIGADGKRVTVASGFPSTISGGGTIGVADVVFLGAQLYAVVAGGGCSHGNPTSPSGIARVDLKTGKWQLIADVGAWLKAHPAKYQSADDFEPDGTLYSAIDLFGSLVTVEPNHGWVLSVAPNGAIKPIIDVSASQGHIVPTSVTARYGSLYVGNLNLFPIDPQWARVLTISNAASPPNFVPGFDGDNRGFHVTDSKAGFTTIVSLKFGPDGLLYVLELSDGPGFPTPGLGKVVRVLGSGEIEPVVTGLVVPTGMTFGPGGALYVSNAGAAPAGAGQILKFNLAPGF